MLQRKIFLAVIVMILAVTNLYSQEGINNTDSNGLKQGRWIKRFENGNILYEGTFKNDKPVGEFKRYYISGQLVSILNYVATSDSVDATFYYPNGYIAARGIYCGRNKTGEWKFYSEEKKETLICLEIYSDNLRQGKSTKYHLNGNKAEELFYDNDKKHGEWIQYYANAVICIRSAYNMGQLNGRFETFHANGVKEITGNYKKGIRTGDWHFFDEDGSLRKTINYINGRPTNDTELIRQETDYLNLLEKNGGKIKDPAKTGVIW